MTKQLDLFQQPRYDALPPRDPTYGLLVQLPVACQCGGTLAVIGAGKGPHALATNCTACGAHRSWLSHMTHDFLTKLVNKFGRPTEPIVLRAPGKGMAAW